MKKILLGLLVLSANANQTFAQAYMTRTGKVTFDATSKSSPEKIEAKNNEVASILDSKTGDLRFQVPIKSFKFEKQLMEEHFNENYMESDKFPKSEFKGKVTSQGTIDYAKNGTYSVSVTGALTVHGVTNTITVPGTLVVRGSNIDLRAKFSVKLADYKISIPSVVADKIDKEATIMLESSLLKK